MLYQKRLPKGAGTSSDPPVARMTLPRPDLLLLGCEAAPLAPPTHKAADLLPSLLTRPCSRCAGRQFGRRRAVFLFSQCCPGACGHPAAPSTKPRLARSPQPAPGCSFAGVEQTFIMGDVTFGACCVDDYSAAALGADFLVGAALLLF